MSRITCKLPLSGELAAALRSMPDADAGAAFKAALTYMAGGEPLALSPAAQVAFNAMRWLIDLGRKRAKAGKSGSVTGGLDTRFAPDKRDFAPSKTEFAPSKQDFAPGKPPEPPRPPEGFDMLAGLDAFL